MRHHVLACDYDGTLATEGLCSPATIAALERIADAGMRLILVTGRTRAELESVFDRGDLFEAIVVENGAVVIETATGDETLLAPRLPGGLVENDETTEQAAVRETKEETGFDVALDGLLVTWMRPGFPILVVIYRAHITAGALQVAPDEASEAKFFTKAELPPLEEIAWPSAAYGLDAWRAYEPPRP